MDTTDHGTSQLRDCLWAVVEQFEDGYILCPIIATGGGCEECYEIFERLEAKYE